MFCRHLPFHNLWRDRWGLVKHWNSIWVILNPRFSISDRNIKSDLMQFILWMKHGNPKLGRKPTQCHKICTLLAMSCTYIRHAHCPTIPNSPGLDSSLLFTLFPPWHNITNPLGFLPMEKRVSCFPRESDNGRRLDWSLKIDSTLYFSCQITYPMLWVL